MGNQLRSELLFFKASRPHPREPETKDIDGQFFLSVKFSTKFNINNKKYIIQEKILDFLEMFGALK